MREDGRQQVCIVGLKEFCVSDVELVKDFIVKGNASRSTGTTGANEESSRSHAILQLAKCLVSGKCKIIIFLQFRVSPRGLFSRVRSC